MVTLVPTVVPISNDTNILGEEHYTARDVHDDVLNFVQGMGIFISLLWTLTNNLCSLRTVGFRALSVRVLKSH